MYLGAAIVDFDGTLRDAHGSIHPADRRCLEELASRGVLRAVATGRSLASFRRAGGDRLAVDYVLFSSGAGLLRVADNRLLRADNLGARDVQRAARVLSALDLDFFVHDPIPDSEPFAYRATGRTNPDFQRRLSLLGGPGRRLDGDYRALGPATQLLAVLDAGVPQGSLAAVRSSLSDLSVLRATSPLDGTTCWVEVFAPGVCKATAAAGLIRRHGLESGQVLAVGNDYNDLDLLEWAGTARLMGNAPQPLRGRYREVAAVGAAGVAEAVAAWLRR